MLTLLGHCWGLAPSAHDQRKCLCFSFSLPPSTSRDNTFLFVGLEDHKDTRVLSSRACLEQRNAQNIVCCRGGILSKASNRDALSCSGALAWCKDFGIALLFSFASVL